MWVIHTENQIQHSFPAIVTDVNHLFVTVKYGDIEPYSTEWSMVKHIYKKENQHDGATFLATQTVKFDVSPNGIVHYRDQLSLAELPANKDNPYLQYRAKYSEHPYGDFDPVKGVQGFVETVWEIESKRPFKRFTKNFLSWFCEQLFFKDFHNGCYMTPEYMKGAILLTWESNKVQMCSPANRTQILVAFFSKCVPYIANWGFWELTRHSGLNHARFKDVLNKLHKAFILSSGRDASSFVLKDYEEARFASITEKLKLKTFQWEEPLEDGVITQVHNERLRTLLGSLSLQIPV